MNSKTIDVIQAVCDGPGVKTRYMIRESMPNEYQNLRRTLSELSRNKVVEKITGTKTRDSGWVLTHQEREVWTGIANLYSKSGSFSVRITTNDEKLLIQPGPNGYQLTTWWKNEDGNRKSSDTWVRYESNAEYVHKGVGTNRHSRSGIVLEPFDDDGDDVIARVIDPDPRHDTITSGIASMVVGHDKKGFHVKLDVFSSECNTPETSTATVPFIDPRDDREAFYEATT